MGRCKCVGYYYYFSSVLLLCTTDGHKLVGGEEATIGYLARNLRLDPHTGLLRSATSFRKHLWSACPSTCLGVSCTCNALSLSILTSLSYNNSHVSSDGAHELPGELANETEPKVLPNAPEDAYCQLD